MLRAGMGMGLAVLLSSGGAGCRPARAPEAAPRPTHSPSVPPVAAPPRAASLARFADVTAAAGIRFRHQSSPTARKYLIETMGSGCAFLDYDGDGWEDLLLLNGAPLPGGHVAGRPTMVLYHNDRTGRFTDVTHAAGLDRSLMYAMGAAVGDYDNDGRDDLYVSGVLGPGRLFHNETSPGVGVRFRDVTAGAGVGNPGHWGTSCAWLDYDRDGLLDLFVCNYVKYASLADDQPCYAPGQRPIYCIPSAYETTHCALFHNEGRGQFQDATSASGIGAAAGKSLGVAVWDYDGDGWPDLFVANDTVPGFLFHNRRNGAFTEVGAESGVAYDEDGDPHSGMGIDAGDLLNDGQTWLAIANFQGQQTSLYRQTSPGLFEDVHQAAKIGPATADVLGFGLLFLDDDNDGYPDLLQVNGHVQDDIQQRQPGVRYSQPALLFQNQHDGTFIETGRSAGRPFSTPMVGRGCAAGDFDNDGRPDLLITTNNGPAYLCRNETRTANHWLTLRLVGTRSNRDGIGALLKVTAGGITRRAMVRGGSSYLSQSDLRLHFGLGPSRMANIEIDWPSGTVDHLAHVPGDGSHTIREGEGEGQ